LSTEENRLSSTPVCLCDHTNPLKRLNIAYARAFSKTTGGEPLVIREASIFHHSFRPTERKATACSECRTEADGDKPKNRFKLFEINKLIKKSKHNQLGTNPALSQHLVAFRTARVF